MKKNTLFLSAAITTFILVILATLLIKAKTGGFVSSAGAVGATATDTQAATDTLLPTNTATLPPTAAAFISPEEAVKLASAMLGNYQIYSVDTEKRYGLDVYKVTFSSGHIVYVNPKGVILSVSSPQAAYVQPTVDQSSSSNSSSSSSSSSSHKSSGGGDGGGGDD
jgi:uncharacterized membrane protein YgcG